MLSPAKLTPEKAADANYCEGRALNFLARREHSQLELAQKLQTRGFDAAVVQATLEKLVAKNFLSDQRFAECFTAERVRRGYGPIRIQQELQQRGVSESIIESVLRGYKNEWFTHAQSVWQKYKRTHPAIVDSDDSKLKQQKFLYQRGFSFDHIREVV
jgi:regulatory protein